MKTSGEPESKDDNKQKEQPDPESSHSSDPAQNSKAEEGILKPAESGGDDAAEGTETLKIDEESKEEEKEDEEVLSKEKEFDQVKTDLEKEEAKLKKGKDLLSLFKELDNANSEIKEIKVNKSFVNLSD